MYIIISNFLSTPFGAAEHITTLYNIKIPGVKASLPFGIHDLF